MIGPTVAAAALAPTQPMSGPVLSAAEDKVQTSISAIVTFLATQQSASPAGRNNRLPASPTQAYFVGETKGFRIPSNSSSKDSMDAPSDPSDAFVFFHSANPRQAVPSGGSTGLDVLSTTIHGSLFLDDDFFSTATITSAANSAAAASRNQILIGADGSSRQSSDTFFALTLSPELGEFSAVQEMPTLLAGPLLLVLVAVWRRRLPSEILA